MNSSKFARHDSGSYTMFCGPAQLEKDLNSLKGLLLGIRADSTINSEEIQHLVDWKTSVLTYRHLNPYLVFARAINEVIADGVITEDELEDLLWLCDQYLNHGNSYYNIITSSIQQLTGFLSGITADRVINQDELEALYEWISESHSLVGTWPFDQLTGILKKTIDERRLTQELHDELLKFCDTVASTGAIAETSNKDLVAAIQEDAVEIIISDSSFCLTGESTRYTRETIASIIESYGGNIKSGVSGKLHYLVVCDEKNACWAFASYGRKVEKAMQLKAKGIGPSVVYEEDLYGALHGLGFVD